MSLASYLAFLAATIVLMIIPGPNVALIVGTSLAHGRAVGLATVAGTTAATAVGLGLAVSGLSAALLAAAGLFEIVRWAGVCYLVVLGIRAFTAPAETLSPSAAAPSAARAMRRGFAVSSTNPKTLLFFGAFLPQFVDPAGNATLQLLLLAATVLAVAGTVDALWACLSHHARPLLAARPRLRNRITGSCLLGAAAGLALARSRA